jgi:hypothetical protein
MMRRKHVDAVLKFAPDFHRRDLLYIASGTKLHAFIALIGRRAWSLSTTTGPIPPHGLR